MDDILNLERFPLDQPDSAAYADLVQWAKDELARDGMFNLVGFMRPDVAEVMATSLAPRFGEEAFRHAREHNIYFRKSMPGLADDHPALARVETVNHTLCADQLAGSALEAIYHFPPLLRFLAEVMDKPALFPMDDPLAAFNAMAYNAGEGLNWHFDRSEFTTTLLLQKPDGGGAFEYRSGLRTPDDPNYDGVARLLEGRDTEKRVMSVNPGTLNVFKGVNTAHRVTPVEGPRARIIAVLTYYERPGARFTDEESLGFYGRTAS